MIDDDDDDDDQDCCKLTIEILIQKLNRFKNNTVRMQPSQVWTPLQDFCQMQSDSAEKMEADSAQKTEVSLAASCETCPDGRQKRLDDCTSALQGTSTHMDPCNQCLSCHKLNLKSKHVL